MRKQYGERPGFCPKCRALVFPKKRTNKFHRKHCMTCGTPLDPLTPNQARWRSRTELRERAFRYSQIRKDRIKKWEDDWDELDEAISLRPGDLEN